MPKVYGRTAPWQVNKLIFMPINRWFASFVWHSKDVTSRLDLISIMFSMLLTQSLLDFRWWSRLSWLFQNYLSCALPEQAAVHPATYFAARETAPVSSVLLPLQSWLGHTSCRPTDDAIGFSDAGPPTVGQHAPGKMSSYRYHWTIAGFRFLFIFHFCAGLPSEG